MVRVRRILFTLVLMALAALVVPLPARAATTTEETGPLTHHEPQTYVYNLGANDDGEYRELYNKATGEHIAWGIDNGKCPILLPGDTVEVIPEPNVPNGHMAKGLSLVNNDNYPQATHYESRGPIEVVKTQTWGGYPFITELRNRSTYPVRIWSNSGGDCAAEKVSDDVSYTYSQSGLDFYYYPASVNVTYEFYCDGRFLTEEEITALGVAYYTDETNPTVFYAEDALVNAYAESNETLGLDVCRPYLEGYRFSEYGGDQYRRGDQTTDSSYRADLSQVYAWRHSAMDGTDKTTFYPQWAVSTYDNQVMNGNEDDTVYITYRFDADRTITLDANGGTIDGYPSRIYEARGGDIENQMDEDYADGAYTPVRPGYVFEGWCLDPECTQMMTSFKDVLKSGDVQWPIMSTYPLELRAKHVYAKWQVDISKAEIAGLSKKTYTGTAITQSPVVTHDGVTLTEDTDYTVSYKNNINAGTATVTITGKGKCTGTKTATFAIEKADVSKATVAAIAAQTYSGKAFAPTPKVTLGGRTLTKGTDYTLSYKNNTNAGTATVTIKGKGNYAGTTTTKFKIKPASISGATIAAVAEQGYTGSAIKPTPAVKVGSTALRLGTDYTLSYKDNTKVGTATVTATGKGNYAGTKSATFKIVNWSGASRIPVNATAKYTCLKDGYLRVKVDGKNAKSDGVLSISGWTLTGKKAGKTTVYLYDKGGKQVAKKTVEVFAAHGKTYEFESSVDKNYVLDIQGGSKKDGAQMIVYRRNNGKNQRYTLYLQSDGTYAIKSVNSGRYLTVEPKTNKYVQQWAWKGTKAQRWRLTVDSANRATFVNVATNKCFDVQGGKTTNSAKMIVWQSNNGLNQKWKLNQK